MDGKMVAASPNKRLAVGNHVVNGVSITIPHGMTTPDGELRVKEGFDDSADEERSQATDNTSRASGVTFASQLNLPRLPIPDLNETMAKLLDNLRPLVDGEANDDNQQWRDIKDVVQDFKDNQGPRLQQLLLDYDREGKEKGTVGSYVEAFWNDAYLAPDASVVLNLNPFFVLEDGPDPKIAKDPIFRASSLAFAAVKMVSQLRKEEMAADIIKGRQLCMDQFRFLFGTARVPRSGSKDTVHVYEYSNHIAVLRRGQMFYFQVLWPDGDVAVDCEDIRDILTAIDKHACETPVQDMAKTALGVLTSLSRKEWARARENMIECHPVNDDALRIVDSALFVLVLDDYVPASINQAAGNMLHGSYELETSGTGMDVQIGTCCNRWYDKLQIIVCGDGTAGINFEHSAIDGHTALRFVSDIYAETVISFAQSITKSIQAHGSSIASVINANVRRAAAALDSNGRATLDVFPKRVPFVLPDKVCKQIYFAETALGDQIAASDTKTLEFKGFGKLFVVANRFSPDSVVQMSIMLAYYKLYGKLVCTYEPVMTKMFYHGRTEAMRSATMEAKQLCEIWCDDSSSVEDKIEALRVATKKHSQLIRECAQGKGVDRHLYALKCIAEQHNMKPFPKFFNSDAWNRLNHTVLSTSNCGNPSLRLFGFGPVVSDGFGIGYIIKDHSIQYSVSSKHRQTKRYIDSLRSVLMEIGEMLKPDTKVKVEYSTRATLQEVGPVVAYDSYGDVWGENALHDVPHTDVNPADMRPKQPVRQESSLTATDDVCKDPQTEFRADRSMDMGGLVSTEGEAGKTTAAKQGAGHRARGRSPRHSRRSRVFSGLMKQKSMEYSELSLKGESLSLSVDTGSSTGALGDKSLIEK